MSTKSPPFSPRLIVSGLTFAAVMAYLYWTASRRPSSTSVDPITLASSLGLPSPSWELKDVDGKLVKSADFAGKVVLLDFWATWCGPCRMEIPSFIELQKEYGEKGFIVVGISLDEDGPGVVKSFMKKTGINYPVLMGDAQISSAFGGIEGIPTTFLIDRGGKIAGKHVGYTEKAVFEKEIKPLLTLRSGKEGITSRDVTSGGTE